MRKYAHLVNAVSTYYLLIDTVLKLPDTFLFEFHSLKNTTIYKDKNTTAHKDLYTIHRNSLGILHASHVNKIKIF